MRHMRSRRILAMLLVLSMIFGLLTTTALADNGVDQNPSNVEESAANGTSAGGSGEGQPSGASEDESSEVTNKEDVPTEEETIPEEKKTTSDEEVDTLEGEGENAVALSDYITVNNDETQYATLEAAIAAAEPENGVITYTVHGSVHVETGSWIEIVKSGLTDITKVEFVGISENAEISTDATDSILNEQTYGVDVIFNNLTLSHPNGKWADNTGHGAVYFTTWVHDSSKTVTYTNCKFPNGACNNQYGKTVYNNCSFENATTGLYNLWVYGGNVELNGGKFTGTRGAKVYTEGDPSAKTPMTVEINGTSFEGLNEKAAIVVSKAATVSLSDVTTTDCTKGTFQKDIEGSNEETTVGANGTGISGTFNVTADKGPEAVKREFNISAGSFDISAVDTETFKDYLAPNTEISADGTVSSGETPATGVATVGGVSYDTLEKAFAALNSTNYTLELLDENAWTGENVYWAAGEQNGYKASLVDALTAAYKANAGDIKIICRPGADVGTMTHGHVADNITIYGNKAYISGGECDLEVDTYKFSRTTGAQAADGDYLTGDITITAYELDNLGVWGQRNTGYTVNVNLTDCDTVQGITVQRVYISGETGVNNITLSGCDFGTKATSVYSNADGDINITNCSFTGAQVPVNFNHKTGGEQTLRVSNCEFNACGDAGEWKQFAAPVRFVNSGSGTQSATVDTCTFTDTVGPNGDILIGDGRVGQSSNNVSLNVSGTVAKVVAQKPGYYTSEGTTNDTLKGEKVLTTSESLTVSTMDDLIGGTTATKGSETNPYTLEELGEMTRGAYIDAQTALGGTMYVTVGDYSYDKNGVLGNGVRDDTTGQIPDHSKLNAYGENGYLGTNNDGANGLNIVFVNGSITSGVTGYETIDGITKITSLLLAVPAYTNVTFKGITFNNVMCFNYQLYTSPWSQLGELKFEKCTFNGIIIGSIAAQTLTFNSCTFENFENTTKANNSNPTWIRPAYGNWTPSDNEGQGDDFKSLTTINFTNNKVTSTRPVKFEYISQWNNTTTIKVDGNTFNMTDDGSHKNVGMYLGAFSDETEFNLKLGTNSKGNTTAAIFALPKGKTSLPVGSTVTDLNDNPTSTDDAVTWHTETKITLKTEPVSTETSIDLATFLAWAEANNYDVDGSNYEGVAAGEKLVVKWSPVTGSYYTNGGTHTCDAVNIPATANTPQRVNNGLTQFQILSGSDKTVTVKNVKFVYTPAAFKLCTNAVASEGQYHGSFEADDAPAGQLYFMTTGDVTFESCDFDKVVLTTFNTTGTSTVTNCNFANVYNNYAIKDIRGANVSVTGTTITNCGGGIMVSSTDTVSKVTLTNNIFKDVDVAGTAPTNKVGTRAILQFASSGDYAKATLDITSNKAENCGPALRQLNEGSEIKTAIKSMEPSLTSQFGKTLYTSDSVKAVPAGYVTDEHGNVTISTAEGLRYFAEQANAGNNFAGKTVTLAENVDLGDKLWTPIGIYGTQATWFKGTFDGQNHTVSGLKVVEYNKYGVGFFGKVYTGTIKNLTVEGNVTAYGCNYVGGIVGHGYATITNCTFRGNVSNQLGYQVGGIAGSGGFTITNCSVYGNVSAESWVGGIAGNVQDGGAYTNCYVEGVISANSAAYGVSAAGIAAIPLYKTQKISGCYSNTVVKCGDEEINAPIIGGYNGDNSITADTELFIYDNSWNKQKNSNDSYEIKESGTVIEGKTVSRDNNLIMFESELQSVTDLNKVRIMPQSSVKQEQVDALAVAAVGESKYISLAAAIAAAEDGNTVTLLKDATEDVEITKNITLDLGGKTLTNTGAGKATITIANGATATVKNGSVVGGTSYYNIQNNGTATFEGLTATAGNDGSSMIDNYGTLTITSGEYTGGLDTIKNEPNAKLTVDGGTFTLKKGSSKGFTGVIFNYGELTINGGTFIQSDKSAPYGQAQVIHTDKSGSNAPSTVIKGGTFKNLCTHSTAWTVRATNAAAGATKVSGGSFNTKVQETYCADGFIPTKNADGTYGVKEGKYVASIGSKNYETLADAIRLAAKGKTVKLLDDVTENVTIADNKNLTLDLNGHTINGGTGTAKATITNYGTVTITDKSTAKTGTIKRDDIGTVGETSYYVIHNLGTMTIEQAIVTNNSGYKKTNPSGSMVGSSLICNGDDNPGGTLNISGGKFEQKNFIAIKNGALGNLNVTGGTISSDHSAIQNWFEATITGGEINGQLWTDAYKEGESVGHTTIGGSAKYTGEIVMDIYGTVKPTLKISGGTLDVTNWRITAAASKAGAKPAVSGGKFTSAVPENYCADGYVPTENEDGTYGVKVDDSVAEVGGVKYLSLQAAINAATKGQTVKLLKDTRENVTIAKALTLDLNGKTLNGGQVKGTPALKVDNASVTIQDSSAAQTGTIMREDTAENSGKTSHYVIDVQGKYGFLKIEGGNIKNNSGVVNVSGKGASLIRLGNDSVSAWPTLTIKGGTFTQNNFIAIKVDRGTLHLLGGEINSANSYAIENWNNAYIKGGTVNGTVSSWVYSTGVAFSKLEISGGTVNGNVASVNYDSAADKQARIYITGGEVTGTLGTYTYSNRLVPTTETAMATVEVTGGTFDKDPTTYVVEGSTVNKNSEGKFGVEKAYLCKIGEKQYYTMDEAFHAVQAGETITMLRDYTTNSVQNSGDDSFTIDLNGFTWTYTGTDTDCAAFEINYPEVSLTVKNGKVISGSMLGLVPTAKGGLSGTIYYSNSSLVFENVVATANGHSGIETNGGNENVTVTLKDSTLNVPEGFGIYFPSSGTLTIDNSKITAKTLGVQVCSGSLDIKGQNAAITVNGDPVPKTENDGAIQDGAAISIVNRDGYKGLDKITVTGGTFTAKEGNDAVKAYNWTNKETGEENFTASDKVAISGGSYSTVVPADLCAEGFVPVTKANADGLFEVTKDTNEAKIGNTKYATLADALKVATSGDTIVLLNDVTHATGFVLNDGILIDLNGHNLTTPFIFTSIEGGAGIIDSSNNANGGSGTLKLMFKKTTLNGISRTAKNSAGTADISGYFFPVFTGETTNEGTTWYNYKIYWGYVYSWPNSGTSTVDSIKFSFSVIFRNREAYQYFVNDPEQINVWFDVLLGNTENGQQSNMSFKFTTDHIKTTWAQATINANGGVVKFNLTFKGLSEYAGATVYGTPYAQSNYTNASMNGSQLTATVQEQG